MATTITTVSPRGGAPGTGVVVTGTAFGPLEGTVTIDGVPATVVSWIDTQITFTVPAGVSTNGTYTLRVVREDLSAFTEEHFWIPATDPNLDGIDYQYPVTEAGVTQNVDLPRRAEAALFNRLLDRILAGGGGGPTPSFSVNLSGGGTVEVGASVVNPNFNATYNNGVPITASLADNAGNPPRNVLGLSNPIVMPYTYVVTTVNGSVNFVLTADDGSGVETDSVSYAWRPRTYWGTAAATGSEDESFIKALGNSALDNNRQRQFTVTANAGEKIWYSYPASYGTATFFVGIFEGGFLPPQTINVTNTYGVTLSYYLYESAVPGLGTTTVTVT